MTVFHKNAHIRKAYLVIFMLLAQVVPQHIRAAEAQDMLNYRALADLPAEELMAQAEKHLALGHADTAIAYYSLVAGMYNQRMSPEEKHHCADAYLQIGKIHYDRNNLFQAFDNHLKGFQIAEKENFEDLLPEMYKDLGRCYRAFLDNEKGRSYALKALRAAREQGQTVNEIKVLNTLIGDYLHANQLDSSKIFYNDIIQLPIEDPIAICNLYSNLASIALYEGKPDTAIRRYHQCIRYATEKGLEKKYKDVNYLNLAELYFQEGVFDSTLKYIRLATNKMAETHTYILTTAVQYLFLILENTAESPRKEQIRKRTLEIADTAFNRYLDEYYGSNIQFLYEIEKNRQEIEALAIEKEMQSEKIRRAWRMTAFSGLAALVLATFLLTIYKQKRQLTKTNQELFNKNKAIIESELQRKHPNSETAWSQLWQATEEMPGNKAPQADSTGTLKPEAKEPSGKSRSEASGSTAEAALTVQENISAEEEENNDKKTYSSSRLDNETKMALVQRIQNVMENTSEYCQSDFDLNHLAELVGSNTSYVSQAINEYYHVNFRNLVNRYRIREAQIRLLDTRKYGNLKIKAIAESVGYKSMTNFIELFKNATGMTPSVYQKMAQTQTPGPAVPELSA